MRGLTTPLLAIAGGDDLQIPPAEAQKLRTLLRSDHHPDHQVELLPGMDHLMMPVEGPPGMGLYTDPSRALDPRMLHLLEQWLRDRKPHAD